MPLWLAYLYFPAATQFEDPFEGAVAVLPHNWPVDPRYVEPELGERAFQQLRRLTKISCWHLADYEGDAMWKLYAATRKGRRCVHNCGPIVASTPTVSTRS